MDTSIIYYYFSNFYADVFKETYSPIVQSIATFRHWNKEVPVHVIDVSNRETIWSGWDEKLNFTVHKRANPLSNIEDINETGITVFKNLLAKPICVYDLVHQLDTRINIVCDADLFWINDPFPLGGDTSKGFCCNPNAGLWYYNRDVAEAQKLMQIWCSLCSHVMVSKIFRDRVAKPTAKKCVQEESCLRCVRSSFPELVNEIPEYENFLFGFLPDKKHDLSKIKGLHFANCHCKYFNRNKSLVCLHIKEVNDIIKEAMGEYAVYKIYKNLYETPSFSIHDRDKMAWFRDTMSPESKNDE